MNSIWTIDIHARSATGLSKPYHLPGEEKLKIFSFQIHESCGCSEWWWNNRSLQSQQIRKNCWTALCGWGGGRKRRGLFHFLPCWTLPAKATKDHSHQSRWYFGIVVTRLLSWMLPTISARTTSTIFSQRNKYFKYSRIKLFNFHGHTGSCRWSTAPTW